MRLIERGMLTGMLGILASSVWAADYSEAPELAEQVAAGTLPPVEERLPENPLVLEPIEGIGEYGGVWRSALKGTFDNGWIRRTVAYQPLVAFDLKWQKVIPNVAESFEANADATEFTFKTRKGHKWSDGAPFTSADLVFAIETLSHEDYAAHRPGFIDWGTIKAEAIDDVTVKITLAEPNGTLMQRLAAVDGPFIVNAPKHFCSQFVPDHNENAAEVAKERGYDSWSQAFEQICYFNFTTAERPTLNAWRQVTNYDGINQVIDFERNPYFFKVDPAGNQLPYIDDIQYVQTENTEDILLKVINGEIDFSNRHFATVTNKPVVFDGQEKGGYRLTKTIDARMNSAVIQLNLNHEDPAKRELYQNKDFRVALSHAIDRQEIIDVMFAGQGTPHQAAPRPESAFYNEELATQYTEFDPDLANELLDGLGLTERNDDGIRLDSQGNPITISLLTASDFTEFNDISQLLVEYWADIGIAIDQRNVERSFAYEHFRSNQHDMHMWWGDGGLGDAILDPRYYLPFNGESAFAYKWAQWFMNPDGAGAEMPSEAAKAQMDLYRQLETSGSSEEQARLFGEILDIAQDEFWAIGISLPPEGYVVANKRLGNVPEVQPFAWQYPQPGPMGTSQLYYKN